MTPPPPNNTNGGARSAKSKVALLPTSFESSAEMSQYDSSAISARPVPLGDVITFVDAVDCLDAMMDANTSNLKTSRTRWNDQRAVIVTGSVIESFLLTQSFAADELHAATIACALIRTGGLIPTFRVEKATEIFAATHTATYVHRGLTSQNDHGLNIIVPCPLPTRPLLDVLCDLASAFARVCHSAVSLDGQYVHYEMLRGSPGWRRCLVLLTEMATADDRDFENVHDDVKKACFFNLYNLMIFHAKLAIGHPNDLIHRTKFFDTAAYIIAGKRLSSIELEHGVLRRTIRSDDDRAALRLREKDPRMHFILNCGAQSCPPLVPINPEEDVNLQLQNATFSFIEKNVDADIHGQRVTISRLWKWFRKDFTPASQSDHDLLCWIAEHASKDMRARITELMKNDFKIKFDLYNWADNGDENAKPDTRFMSIYDLSFSRSV